MTYSETLEYLFNAAPLFQQQGVGAYKEGLGTTLALDEHFGYPHRRFRTIHIAGTNGKGSCSHTIAAVLQSAGYKVGLYTSPHLVDFRERIRVNGAMIPEEYVVDFVEKERPFFEPLYPSFFELATAMAFKYFADQAIDVAVVEVGLGGRLDCTNIIQPVLSVITNISFDHIGLLGNTLPMIAAEKAGIIKASVPVVIGESLDETRPVFVAQAERVGTRLVFAEEATVSDYGTVVSSLTGYCQQKNTQTILTALRELDSEFRFSADDVHQGFAHVCELTGLRGRWQQLSASPLTICDTGHNVAGIEYVVRQLLDLHTKGALRMVFGMVNDKDISTVLSLLPKDAVYYFCNASVKRALASSEMAVRASQYGLHGTSCGAVSEAYAQALRDAGPDDVVFVGGSSFVVADLLTEIKC